MWGDVADVLMSILKMETQDVPSEPLATSPTPTRCNNRRTELTSTIKDREMLKLIACIVILIIFELNFKPLWLERKREKKVMSEVQTEEEQTAQTNSGKLGLEDVN
jgi:hypothetical protein